MPVNLPGRARPGGTQLAHRGDDPMVGRDFERIFYWTTDPSPATSATGDLRIRRRSTKGWPDNSRRAIAATSNCFGESVHGTNWRRGVKLRCYEADPFERPSRVVADGCEKV